MSWLDALLGRKPPPDDERTVKEARLDVLEDKAFQSLGRAEAALKEHRRQLQSYADVRLRR